MNVSTLTQIPQFTEDAYRWNIRLVRDWSTQVVTAVSAALPILQFDEFAEDIYRGNCRRLRAWADRLVVLHTPLTDTLWQDQMFDEDTFFQNQRRLVDWAARVKAS